jgi:hypothetical protein
MVGWCANDYQIDIATVAGRTEYQRIFDMASELGADHVLFAPANSEVSRREDNRDDWGWENSLWLGLGQKIRQNQWDPASGPIPASVQQMLDYAPAEPRLVPMLQCSATKPVVGDKLCAPPGQSRLRSFRLADPVSRKIRQAHRRQRPPSITVSHLGGLQQVRAVVGLAPGCKRCGAICRIS